MMARVSRRARRRTGDGTCAATSCLPTRSNRRRRGDRGATTGLHRCDRLCARQPARCDGRASVRFALPEGSRVMDNRRLQRTCGPVDRDRVDVTLRSFRASRPRNDRRVRHDRAHLAVLRCAPPAESKASPPWLRTRIVGPDRTTLHTETWARCCMSISRTARPASRSKPKISAFEPPKASC